MAGQLLGLAEREQNPGLLLQAHQALAGVLLHGGEVAAAHTHWEQALALCSPLPERVRATPGSDLRVVCLSYLAWCLWLLGYPAQAEQRSHEALTLAQELAHPFTLVFALNYAAWLAYFHRDMQRAQEHAEVSIRLATELGVADFLAAAMLIRGWSLAMQGQGEAGLGQLRQGVVAYRATGAGLHMTSILVLFAAACGHLGHIQEGLAALDEAFVLRDTYGECHYEAELYRLKGELLLAVSRDAYLEATTCFQHALAMARQQQTKSWELRAAMSLSRLWQRQGKREQAFQLLADLYGEFTEGLDTRDLQAAQALLARLA